MPQVNKSALVGYSAQQMYNLVNDIDAYSDFLPGCKASNVLDATEQHMRAKMVLSKAGIEKELITFNQLTKDESIQMTLDKGPFKSLQGEWKFTPLSEEACRVELSLEFIFKNRLTEVAFAKIFTSLANNMVKAFINRAKLVYG